MDEQDGRVAVLPCCLGWIKQTYGFVDEAPLTELWNSPGAQKIRALIASGRQDEVCDRHCKYLTSGRFSEEAWEGRVIDGPANFVANQRLNSQEISERRTVLCSRPMMLKVISTFRCNIRCTMCFQKHFGPAELGIDFWPQIEEHLPYANEAIFQGGEATVDRGFRAFLTGAALRAHPHVGIGLITNGTIFDNGLQQAISAVRVQFVNVSINAARSDTYLAVTNRDVFDSVVANTRRWVELSNSHRMGRFPVYASFVVMRSNFRELPDFVQLADNIGATVQLQMLIGDPGQENILRRKELDGAFRDVLDQAERIAGDEAKKQLIGLRTQLPSNKQIEPSENSRAMGGSVSTR